MRIPFALQVALAAGLGFGSVWFVTNPLDIGATTAFAVAGGSNCNIKGNVSINSGERIYHVPGQEFYAQTKIDPQYGERWFCSEAEARAAGWRKAKR